MNLANWITILRILFVPFFVILLAYGWKLTALLLFCLAGITDGVDGYIARTRKIKTELGSILDPLADKFLLISSFIMLTIKNPKLIPLWFTIIIISREFVIVMGAVIIQFITNNFKAKPTVIGKITTAFQILTVFIALVINGVEAPISIKLLKVFIVLTTVLAITSGSHYIYLGTKQLNGK